jgi:hypothetical protein
MTSQPPLSPPEPLPPEPHVPPPPDVVPPPPPPPHRDESSSRLIAMIPFLLAALGLAAAVIAWRAGVAASAADDATRAGIDAGRELAATQIANEGQTARAMEAYLDYERARQRAEALAAAGISDEALLNRMQATSHWFLVRPEYVDRTGQFQPDQELAALLSDAQQTRDIQPEAHFQQADAEYNRLRGLIGAGIVVALALPFLTLAEVGRGRLRIVGVLLGSGILVAGLAVGLISWL